MNNERYIVKNINGQLVTQPLEDSGTCAAWTAGGGLLAAVGLRRGGLSGLVMTLAGGGIIYRGVTGKNPLATLFCRSDDALNRGNGPSYQNDQGESRRQSQQTPQDSIDEASMESFPASDPPAHMPAPAGG